MFGSEKAAGGGEADADWQLLAGVTVLEIEGDVASGWCSRLLMGLGARVVRIESSGDRLRQRPPFYAAAGQQNSAVHSYLSAGKLAVFADIRQPEGAADFSAHLGQAQILVVQGRTDALAERGIDLALIRSTHPSLVIGQVTGFADGEGKIGLVGDEFQAQALGGLLHMVGAKSREPLRLGGYQAHYAAGLALMSSIMAALYNAEKTGSGQLIQTSLFEAVAYVEWKSACQYQHDGARLSRGGSIGPFILKCKDGHSAFYYRDRNWDLVCRLFDDARLQDPRFETQKGRDAHRSELAKILGSLTADREKRDIYHAAQALGMPVGYCATAEDIVSSPQYADRAFLVDLDIGDHATPGRIPQLPWRVNGQRPSIDARVDLRAGAAKA